MIVEKRNLLESSTHIGPLFIMIIGGKESMLENLRAWMPAIGKSLHSKLLFSFIALTILIVLSTTLIFSSMYINTINNELTLVAANDLDRVNTEFDSLFSQTRNLFRLLKENPDINAFLFFSNFDPLILNRTDSYLKQVQYTSPFFYSISLYNQSYDYPIFAGKAGIDVSQFAREKLDSPNTRSDFNFVLSTITANSTTGIDQINRTLSIVYRGSALNDSTNRNLAAINLDREEIEKKLFGKLEGITIVTDDSGKVIFNPYDYINPVSVSEEPYYRKIREDKEYKGSFRLRVGNDNKLITYVKNMESGLYIINIKSLNSITMPIAKARTTFIVISLLIALIFSLSGYFLSSRLSLPLKRVTEKFASSRFGEHAPSMAETDMISKVFEETTEHLRALEDKNENNCSRHKENILRLLLESGITPELAKQELSDCSLKVEFSTLILVCLKIDSHTGIDDNSRLIYEASLCKIIPELLKEEFQCEVVKMFEGEIALLLNYKITEENNFHTLLSSIDKIRSVSDQTFHITLTAGIGGAADSIGDCTGAYRKAMEMVKHRFVLGQNLTIYKQLVFEKLSANLSYPKEIEDTLTASIRANKRVTFLNTLNDFIELLGNYYYSEVVSVLFQVMTSCIKTINQVTSQESSKRFLNFDEFSSIFSELQTLEQAKNWLISIFDEYQQIVEQINQLKSNKHFKAVEKMQEYIKAHYHNMSLSVELIADMAGYTPSYFTRIFKEISGLYVNDYIRQVRINKAKELLCLPDSKISDIPASIGFTNLSHFSTVFKKDVGLTPSAYREYVINQRAGASS